MRLISWDLRSVMISRRGILLLASIWPSMALKSWSLRKARSKEGVLSVEVSSTLFVTKEARNYKEAPWSLKTLIKNKSSNSLKTFMSSTN
jgi:hypothetical protein